MMGPVAEPKLNPQLTSPATIPYVCRWPFGCPLTLEIIKETTQSFQNQRLKFIFNINYIQANDDSKPVH